MKIFSFVLSLIFTVSCSGKQEYQARDTAMIFSDMDLGQMLLVGFRGTELDLDSPIVHDITALNLGGVILFDYDVESKSFGRNITDTAQLSKLTDQLNQYSTSPLFIAIDQEGGQVSRLKSRYGFPASVSAEYLGNTDSEDTTRFYAGITADLLHSLNINVNFAPVVDVNTNPDNPVIAEYERSYSRNPDKVAEHAEYVIDELNKAGILPVLKHFPGHGSSTTDSHLGVTDVTETWDRSELSPYEQLLNNANLKAVMTAHIYNAGIDSVWPATLSSATINGLLRDTLGFDGLVFSDDMQMEAIRAEYGLETAIEQALNAGVDVLVFGNNLVYDEDIAGRAIRIIRNLLREGKISEDTIRDSLLRIQHFKKKLSDSSVNE